MIVSTTMPWGERVPDDRDTRSRKTYIASTDVNGPAPHVVAQWDGDDLTEVVVNNVTGGPLTYGQFEAGWRIALDLYAVREES